MMLQDVLTQLSVGEFAQLSLGGQNAGVINNANLGNVVAHIQLGLTALYSRFNLKEGQLKVELQPGLQMYQMNSRYATSNVRSREAVQYLLDDMTFPFEDDLLKVTRVYVDSGVELYLNDKSHPYSINTPMPDTLLVPSALVNQHPDLPDELKTTYLTVHYSANHPKLIKLHGCPDPERTPFLLPEAYLAALLYFVASRVHNPIGMVNEFHAGNSYAAKYEMECQRLEGRNLDIDEGDSNHRFARSGWI